MSNYVRSLLILCIPLFCCSLAISAQDSSSKRTAGLWSLKDCIEYARDNNIAVTTQVLNSRIAAEQYSQARAAVLPDLYGNASQNFNHTGRSTTGRDFNINGSLGLSSSLTLYRGGYIHYDVRERNMQVESVNLSILERINDISIQVTQAYLAILLDKENIAYIQDLVNTSKAQLKRATEMFDVGSLSRKDLLQAQAQLASDQYNLATSIGNERRDRTNLKQLLMLTDTTFDIIKPDTIRNPTLIPALPMVQEAALANRPEVKNADLGIGIAQMELSKARALARPALSLSGAVGSAYANDPTFSVIRQFDNNFYQQVGLSLSVPIFTKRVNKTNINIARIGVEQAGLNRNNTITTLLLNIERAYVNAISSQQQYDAALSQLGSAREVYSIANAELRIGSSNFVELLVQRNQYIQALQNYLNAKYNAALASRIYDYYMVIPITD